MSNALATPLEASLGSVLVTVHSKRRQQGSRVAIEHRNKLNSSRSMLLCGRKARHQFINMTRFRVQLQCRSTYHAVQEQCVNVGEPVSPAEETAGMPLISDPDRSYD